MVSKNIAIIPARGSSKRIPNKNIMDFHGKPMIAWSIEAAQQSNLFDRVLVSTDDERTAKIAKRYHADVPFLRNDHADDYAPVSKATTAALEQAKAFWQEDYKLVVQLMANCPLRAAIEVKQHVNEFLKHDRSFQISCFKYGWMNPSWWAATLEPDSQPKKIFPQAGEQRSQDLPALYCPTGAIWIAKSKDLIKSANFYGPEHVFEPIPWTSAVDIDDYEDLAFANAIFTQLNLDKAG